MENERDPLRMIPTQHTPEVKVDIGAALRSCRLKKGASLEAVAQQTRIPKKFLEALEANRLEDFPALAYLRGFLKNYCDFLEVDFAPLWSQVVRMPMETAAGAQTQAGQPPAQQPAKPPLAAGSPDNHAVAAAALATGLAAVLAGAWLFSPRRSPPASSRSSEPALPAALRPLKPPMEPQLTLLFRRDMWVSLSLDGVEKFQGRVPKGSRQQWRAKRSIALRASDPEALRLTLNGAPYTLSALGADGAFHIETP